MRDFDEKIIWTCDSIPLVASYSKGSLSFFFLFFIFYGGCWIHIHFLLFFYQATCNIQYGLFKLIDLDMKLPKENLEAQWRSSIFAVYGMESAPRLLLRRCLTVHTLLSFFLWICQDEDNQYNKFLNNNPSVNVLFWAY